jgi:PAS domain S-box-containing protein
VEDELRIAQEQLRLVTDNMAAAVTRCSRDLRYVWVSQVYAQWLRRTQEEIAGQPILEVVGREAYQVILPYMERVLLGQKVDYEASVNYRGLGSRWIHAVYVPTYDDAGSVNGWVAVVTDITEHKQLIDSLQAAHARTESVLASVADTHILFDRQWRYVYVNEAAARAIGLPRKHIVGLGRTLWELFPDIVDTELDRQYHRAMNDRVPVVFEFHYLTRDTWWQNRFYPVPEGLAVFATDITERKRAEEALHRTHDELEQGVFERTEQLSAANAALAKEIVDRKQVEAELLALKDELTTELTAMNRLHEVSTRLLITTELQPLLEEVLDATIALLNADFGNVQLHDAASGTLKIVAQRGFKQEFLDYFNSVHEGTASCGAALERRERVIIEDVLTDPLFAPHLHIVVPAGYRAVQSTPLISRAGEMLGIISTHFRQPHRPSERELRLIDLYAHQTTEMVERKCAEERLRRSEAYLAEAQRLSHTGSWAWNVVTGEIFWSQEHFRIFGLDSEKATPTYEMFFQTVHPEDRTATKDNFERAVHERSACETEYRIVRPDGMIRHIHSISHPVFNASGNLVEYVGTVIDITERKRAKKELQKAQAELAHAGRITLMGELAASIAHEINQPLGSIVNNGSVAMRLAGAPDDSRQELLEVLSDIVKDADRASAIIASIRALGKKSIPEKSSLQLKEVLSEMLAFANRELNERRITVRTELPNDLPRVSGDRVQLQQVLLNLVINAIEAMSAVKDEQRILTIGGEPDELGGQPSVRITVRDAGHAFKPEDSERLFDAFYTTKPDGLGMGLRISRSIIEAHGGQLWATLNDGQGATFHFALPANG